MDFFIDIHAHSSAMNCFMYLNSVIDDSKKDQQLVYPKLLDAKTKVFSFMDTKTCRNPYKLGTGRR